MEGLSEPQPEVRALSCCRSGVNPSFRYRKNLKKLVRDQQYLPPHSTDNTIVYCSLNLVLKECVAFYAAATLLLTLACFSAFLLSWRYYQVKVARPSFLSLPYLFQCSPKFFAKIQYIRTLSELAEHVPLTQIDIAPAVYQYVFLLPPR